MKKLLSTLALCSLLSLTPSCSTTYQSYTLKEAHDKNTQNSALSKNESIKITLLSKKLLDPKSLNITLLGYERSTDLNNKEIIIAKYLNTVYHRAEQIQSDNSKFSNKYLFTIHPKDLKEYPYDEYGYVIKSFKYRDSIEREFFNFLGGLEHNVFPGTRKISVDLRKKNIISGSFIRE